MKMTFDKTWVVLLAGCGVFGLAFWSGMNATTLKTILLWLFIGFGFLTFLMHLFGSPISVLLGKVFKTAEEQSTPARYSDAEVEVKRQRMLKMKQLLQDSKVEIYKENVLTPREEGLKAKQEAEFYKFNSIWRGKGQRIRDLRDETTSEDKSDTVESQSNIELMEDTKAALGHDEAVTKSLHQRRNRNTFELAEEPKPTEKGVLTVALRCPNGTVKKRRFTKESQIKMLFAFVELLGYSRSRHVILTTYPRRQLSDDTQTFIEAGLTHDTALVVEEI